MNDQLKKDIQEWQEKADKFSLPLGHSDEMSINDQMDDGQALIDEARTLLLRASESV